MLEPPALAELLHEVESEAAAAIAVRSAHRDDAVVARVLDLEADLGVRAVEAEDERRLSRRVAVEHAVGHQLGGQQLYAIEHGRGYVLAQTAGDDRAPRN